MSQLQFVREVCARAGLGHFKDVDESVIDLILSCYMDGLSVTKTTQVLSGEEDY